MDAIPFDFPAAAIPFVVMSAQASGVQAPLRVLFDTGNAAPFAVLVGTCSSVAEAAAPTGEAAMASPGVTGGGVAEFTPARLTSFQLGPIELHDVSVGRSPSIDAISNRLPGGLDAIVGQTFAQGRVVSVDYQAHRIDFAATPGPPDAALPMTLTPNRPFSVVQVKINGRGPYRMVLDTGAGATLLSPQAARDAGLGESGRTMPLGGVGGTATGRLETADVAFGPEHFDTARIVVADMFETVSREAGAPIDGVLGAPLLAHDRLILDYPGRRLWIEKP